MPKLFDCFPYLKSDMLTYTRKAAAICLRQLEILAAENLIKSA